MPSAPNIEHTTDQPTHGHKAWAKQGVGMVMPWNCTELGMAQGGATACPGTTTALEKMVVP
jgi:hypothetical protein